MLEKLKISLAIAAIFIGLDAVVWGSLLLSLSIGPIWIAVAIVKALIQKDGRVSLARIAIPVVTVTIVLGNAILQSSIARGNAERVIEACTRYKAANGAYPKTLDQLVPAFLSAVPPAKYALILDKFGYFATGDNRHFLVWTSLPPYGRSYYEFESGQWKYRD